VLPHILFFQGKNVPIPVKKPSKWDEIVVFPVFMPHLGFKDGFPGKRPIQKP
jgi:hypothetical protein